MGFLLSTGFVRKSFVSHHHMSFLVRSERARFLVPTHPIEGSRRAQERSRMARQRHRRRILDGSEHDGRHAVVGMTEVEGSSRLLPRVFVATSLYSVGRDPNHDAVCASAAKLRGGGPILKNGMEAIGSSRGPATSNRQSATCCKPAHRAEAVMCSCSLAILPLVCGTECDALGHHAIPDEVPQSNQKLARQGDDHLLA